MGAAAESEVVGLNEWPGSGLVGGGGERGCVWVCRQTGAGSLCGGGRERRDDGELASVLRGAAGARVERRSKQARLSSPLSSFGCVPGLAAIPPRRTRATRALHPSHRPRPSSRSLFPLATTLALPAWPALQHARPPTSVQSVHTLAAGRLRGPAVRRRASDESESASRQHDPAHRPLQTLLQAGQFLSRCSESIARSGSAKRGRGAARLQDSAASERCPISPPHQPARARCCDG